MLRVGLGRVTPINARTTPPASFFLPFTDSGAGAVSLVERAFNTTPTFTRATTATTIGSTGLVASVASGTARSYYDPTSLAYLGYLAEGARTNLLLQSSDLTNASWSKTDTTPTLSGTGPDGVTNSANLLTEGVAGTSAISQTVTGTADANYALSFWGKAGTVTWQRTVLSNGANTLVAWANFSTGAVGSTSVAGTALLASFTAQAYPNGWTRFTLVGSVGSGATAITVSAQGVTADGGTVRVNNGTRSVWGWQFENNVSFASSHMPTTVASFTRNADVLSYSTAWMATNLGTMSAQFQSLGVGGGTNKIVAQIQAAGDSSQRWAIRVSTTDVVQGLQVGAAVAAVGAISNATTVKAALAWSATDANALAISKNGVAPVTGTAVANPLAPDTLFIGNDGSQAISLFGPISSIRYFPQRLSNSVLQQLTT